MNETFEATYAIRRNFMSSASGCQGSPVYDRIDGENLHGCPQPKPRTPIDLLGEDLGEGSVVKVTVEILDAKKVPARGCKNPWSGHKPFCPRRKK